MRLVSVSSKIGELGLKVVEKNCRIFVITSKVVLLKEPPTIAGFELNVTAYIIECTREEKPCLRVKPF